MAKKKISKVAPLALDLDAVQAVPVVENPPAATPPAGARLKPSDHPNHPLNRAETLAAPPPPPDSVVAFDPEKVALDYKEVFNEAEWHVFLKEVSAWKTAHPDWSAKEDVDDIMAIAIEKVNQLRLLKRKRNRVGFSIEDDYNASVKRVQEHRKNLMARRADRDGAPVSGKKAAAGAVTNNYHTNIAVLAASVDEGKRLLRERALALESEETTAFPRLGVGRIIDKTPTK